MQAQALEFLLAKITKCFLRGKHPICESVPRTTLIIYLQISLFSFGPPEIKYNLQWLSPFLFQVSTRKLTYLEHFQPKRRRENILS